MRRPNSVLILEDEGLVSLMLEDLMRDLGARVVDVFASAADAVSAAATRHYDCAILDLVVRDGYSTPVADVLEQRGVPFMFSSGLGAEAIEPRHRARRLLSKPFRDEALKAHVMSLLWTEPAGA